MLTLPSRPRSITATRRRRRQDARQADTAKNSIHGVPSDDTSRDGNYRNGSYCNGIVLRVTTAKVLEGLAAGILFLALPLSVIPTPLTHGGSTPLLSSELRVGVVFTAFGLCLALGQWLSPRIFKAWSSRQRDSIPYWGYGVAALLTAVYFVPQEFSPFAIGALLLARALQGVTLGIATPHLMEQLVRSVDAESRGRIVGFHNSLKSWALAAGPLAGGVLIASSSLDLAYGVALLLGLASCWALRPSKLLLPNSPPALTRGVAAAPGTRVPHCAAGDSEDAPYSVDALLPFAAFAAAGTATLLAVLQVHFHRDLGLSSVALGGAFAAMLVVRALCSWPIGQVADRTSDAKLMSLGLGLMSLSVVALGFSENALQLLGSRAFMGLGMALFTIPCFARAGRSSRRECRVSRFSEVGSGFALGVAVGPLLSAILIAVGGLSMTISFWFLACAASSGWIVTHACGSRASKRVDRTPSAASALSGAAATRQ